MGFPGEMNEPSILFFRIDADSHSGGTDNTPFLGFAPAARSAEEEWQKDIIFTVESLILAQDER
uniref:Uncharacterized protein n=1 Tax=uncultured Prevotella sp. TaxID=159272 RepID=A0A6G8F1Y8_9BACT|nr:hypothetical protein Prevot485_3450 [uncultured Prevotella sp.]